MATERKFIHTHDSFSRACGITEDEVADIRETLTDIRREAGQLIPSRGTCKSFMLEKIVEVYKDDPVLLAFAAGWALS